jgi:methylated-DNA-[protein]-cysteine S-methyltransferase
METAYFKTPLGIAKIMGDENGISVISVLDEGTISPIIPAILQESVSQLDDYFEGKRNDFTFKLNPVGTEFQQKVWKGLLEIPFGKTVSYMELSKKLGDVKAIRAVASANGKNPALDCGSLSQSHWNRWFAYRLCRRIVAQKMVVGTRKPV